MTKAFDLLKAIAAAAKAGERCPRKNEYAMRRLLAEGWVEVRVYARNWRVVKIVRGEFAGLETLAPPCGTEPYLINTSGGLVRHTRLQRRTEAAAQAAAAREPQPRAEPSKPRPLTREEINR